MEGRRGDSAVKEGVAGCSVTRARARVWRICISGGLRSTTESGFGQFRRQNSESELTGGTGAQRENLSLPMILKTKQNKKQLSLGLETKTKGVLENNGSDTQNYKIKQQKELVSLGVDQGGPAKDEITSQKIS